jgi:hypothetical protein
MLTLILAAALAIPPGGEPPSMSPSEAAVENSSWETVYGKDDNSFAVAATLTFRGDVGKYAPAGKSGLGLLTNITYRPSAIEGATNIHGDWFYAGVTGWFNFTAIPAIGPHDSKLQGSWGYGPYTLMSRRDGFWISRRKN